MDQNRKDAAAWAREWQIRRKNRRILYVIAGILIVAALGFLIRFIVVKAERTTFRSADEMRQAVQGRYENDYYEDLVIDGDRVTLTYLAFSHYDRDYAERYGYDPDDKDSVFTDRIVKWDYRHGVLKTEWMGDLVIDKAGNIRREDSYYGTFFKTDRPRPDPIDPSTLNNGTEGTEEMPSEEEEMIEEREEVIESDEDASEDAETGNEEDVQA